MIADVLSYIKWLSVRGAGVILAAVGIGIALGFPGGFIYSPLHEFFGGKIIGVAFTIACMAASILFWRGVFATKHGERLIEWYTGMTLAMLKY